MTINSNRLLVLLEVCPVRKSCLDIHLKQHRLIVAIQCDLHFHDRIGDTVVFLPDQFQIVVDILILRWRTRRAEGTAIYTCFRQSLAHIVKHGLSLVELRHPDQDAINAHLLLTDLHFCGGIAFVIFFVTLTAYA